MLRVPLETAGSGLVKTTGVLRSVRLIGSDKSTTVHVLKEAVSPSKVVLW